MKWFSVTLSWLAIQTAWAASTGSFASSNLTLPQLLALEQQLSPCTQACLTQVVPAAGCSLFDPECQCASQNITTIASVCMLANCTMKESLDLIKFHAVQCNLPHNSRNTLVKVFTLGSGLIAFIMVGLRVFARYWVVGKLWWDDWFHVASLAFTLPLTTFANLCAFHGFGDHVYDVAYHDASRILLWFYLCQSLWATAIILVKFSLLSLYIRIFPSKTFHIAVYTVMVVATVAFFITTPMAILQCVPVAAIWNFDIKQKKCLDIADVALSSAASNIATEVAILLLPMPMLKGLQLRGHKRLALYALFGAGILVIAVAVARIPSLTQLGKFDDPTFNDVNTLLWTCAESTVAHICAAAPAIRTLFSAVRGTSTVAKSHGYYSRKGSQPLSSNHGGILSTTTTQVEKGPNVELQNLSPSQARDQLQNQTQAQALAQAQARSEALNSNPPPQYGQVAGQHFSPKAQGMTVTTISAGESGLAGEKEPFSPRYFPFTNIRSSSRTGHRDTGPSSFATRSKRDSASKNRSDEGRSSEEESILGPVGIAVTRDHERAPSPQIRSPGDSHYPDREGELRNTSSPTPPENSLAAPIQDRSFLDLDERSRKSWI